MKKFLAMITVTLLVLTGCGSSVDHYSGQSDYTYEGETAANDEGEVTTAKVVTKADGTIVSVAFDVTLADGSSKMDSIESGTLDYGCCDSAPWNEEIHDLESTIVENNAFPTLNADGTATDGQTSATVNLSPFSDAFNAALAATPEYNTVEYDKEGDDITNVVFDTQMEGGSKTDQINSGALDYGCCTSAPWVDEIADLDRAVEENDTFPTIGDDYHVTDGTTTATIKLNGFQQAFENAQLQ